MRACVVSQSVINHPRKARRLGVASFFLFPYPSPGAGKKGLLIKSGWSAVCPRPGRGAQREREREREQVVLLAIHAPVGGSWGRLE